MKVRELIEILSEYDPEMPVLVSKDAEGNGYDYARVVDGDNIGYTREGYECEIGCLELTDELRSKGYTDEDVRSNATPCVVIWP